MVFEREYSKHIIDSQMRKVKFVKRSKVRSKQAGVGVPFVIAYHPNLKMADFQICFFFKKLVVHF